MTREEAIDVLKRNYPSSCFEDLCKAVDIAIKALEQHGVCNNCLIGNICRLKAALGEHGFCNQ